MNTKKFLSLSIIILMIIFLVKIPSGETKQLNWWPLPPYNTLWPLWSTFLSPPNILGIPQPVVSRLTPNTVLPVQPGLTWDPNLDYPWLLYNTPVGMAYYDPIFGIDLWPPKYLVNPLGVPLPIDLSLITGWSTLTPTSNTWLTETIPVANSAYYTSYPQYAPLLTPAALLGITALVP